MDWFSENWVFFVVMAATVTLALFFFRIVWKLPRAKQLEAVKSWLLFWVLKAEAALGAGTGEIKLAMVYDGFVQRYPWLAKIVPFDTFRTLVDGALETAENLLQNRPDLLETIRASEALPTVGK